MKKLYYIDDSKVTYLKGLGISIDAFDLEAHEKTLGRIKEHFEGSLGVAKECLQLLGVTLWEEMPTSYPFFRSWKPDHIRIYKAKLILGSDNYGGSKPIDLDNPLSFLEKSEEKVRAKANELQVAHDKRQKEQDLQYQLQDYKRLEASLKAKGVI